MSHSSFNSTGTNLFREYSNRQIGYDFTFSSSISLDAKEKIATSTRSYLDDASHGAKFKLEGIISSTPEVKAFQEESNQAKAFRKGLEDILDSEVIEAGMKSLAERHVESWLKIDKVMVLLEFGKLCLENTGNPRRLVGILNIITHASKEDFSPVNELVALSCLAHSSVEVKEFAVGVYEYWGDPALAEKLKDYEMTPLWLDDYRKEVIAELCGI